MPVEELVDPRRQAPAGPAQGAISWLVEQTPVVPQCHWVALEVGAVLVGETNRGVDRDGPVQGTVRVGTDQARQRFQTVCQGPKSVGRSRQAIQHR